MSQKLYTQCKGISKMNVSIEKQETNGHYKIIVNGKPLKRLYSNYQRASNCADAIKEAFEINLQYNCRLL